MADLSTFLDNLESVVTTFGILVAGAWSYLTFLRGRSFAPNIQIHFRLKQVIDLEESQAIVATIHVKNIGKTRVNKEKCILTIVPIKVKVPLDMAIIYRADPPLDKMMQSLPDQYLLFEEHVWFEPDEEATEELFLALRPYQTCKMNVIFFGAKQFMRRQQQWSSSAIFDTRMKVDETSEGTQRSKSSYET